MACQSGSLMRKLGMRSEISEISKPQVCPDDLGLKIGVIKSISRQPMNNLTEEQRKQLVPVSGTHEDATRTSNNEAAE